MNKKIIVPIVAVAAIVCIGALVVLNLPLKVATPKNITASYDGKGTVTVEWNAVENAVGYEFLYGGSTYDCDDDFVTISDVEEGMLYNYGVRAIREKRGKKYYSDWAETELDIPVMLGKLGDVSTTLSGSYLYLNWLPVDGATSYEIKLGEEGTVVALNDNSSRITNCSDGESIDTYIRAVRNIGSHTYYSDWAFSTRLYPAYDYASIQYENALDLDLDRLKLFAGATGLKVDVEEKDGVIFADLHRTDPNNSGFANGLSRVIGSAIGGFLVGSTNVASEAVDEDLSEIDSMVNAFVSAGGIKEYAAEKSEEMDNAGKAGAIVYGLKALFMDTDIHYIYRYTDPKASAKVCEMYMIHVGNENYNENRYSSYTKASDDLYHFVTPGGNSISVYTGQVRVDSTTYNVSVIGYEN